MLKQLQEMFQSLSSWLNVKPYNWKQTNHKALFIEQLTSLLNYVPGYEYICARFYINASVNYVWVSKVRPEGSVTLFLVKELIHRVRKLSGESSYMTETTGKTF